MLAKGGKGNKQFYISRVQLLKGQPKPGPGNAVAALVRAAGGNQWSLSGAGA